MLEINPKHRQEAQESYNRHLKDIVEGSITNVQIELSSYPAMYHNGPPSLHSEKRTFTYEGYTQAGKRFSLIINE